MRFHSGSVFLGPLPLSNAPAPEFAASDGFGARARPPLVARRVRAAGPRQRVWPIISPLHCWFLSDPGACGWRTLMYFYPFHPLPPPLPGKLFENQTGAVRKSAWKSMMLRRARRRRRRRQPPRLCVAPFHQRGGGETEFHCLKVGL